MKAITGKHVLKQLKDDLIGKDSYRGVTLTYTWLANQFGHFSLGFIPTCFVYLAPAGNTAVNPPSLSTACGVAVFWLLFETYNFLGPLLFRGHSKSKVLFVHDKNFTFQPPWKNIAFDTITDLCFFWLGAFSASLLFCFSNLNVFILLVIVLFLVYPCKYWYLTKMYLQIPKYPYQFRLPQWNLDISPKDQDTVRAFLNSPEPNHLFIFGAKRCGKTSLGVAVATELSIKHRPSFYTTAIKLYTMMFETDEELLEDSESFWTWRNCEILVIDDVNPGEPITRDLVSPHKFKEFIEKSSSENKENREAIKKLSVVWVMGSEDPENKILNNWTEMLKDLDVEAERILSINLRSSQ